MALTLPEGTLEFEGKVYRRKRWKASAYALVLVGKIVDEKNAEGVPTGNKVFEPLVDKTSINPLKAARKAAHSG